MHMIRIKVFAAIFIVYSFSFSTFSCKSGFKNGISEIRSADSATIIYYDRPPDNRFFKIARIPQLSSLNALIEDSNSGALKGGSRCETYGKIYFYRGTEQVYIVYFSEGNCSELSYIRNGEKYTVPMGDASREILEKYKTLAREPLSRE